MDKGYVNPLIAEFNKTSNPSPKILNNNTFPIKRGTTL